MVQNVVAMVMVTFLLSKELSETKVTPQTAMPGFSARVGHV